MSAGGTLGGYFDGKIADVQTWGAYMTPTAVAAISGTPGYVLFPNDSHQYPSGSSWTTASAMMTFSAGVLTITQTGSGTTSTSYGTSGYSGAVLVLQTDGNLVIYSDDGAILWASNTAN
jgi:hypothetical protein